MMSSVSKLSYVRFPQKQSLRQGLKYECFRKEVPLAETGKEARETEDGKRSPASMHFGPGQAGSLGAPVCRSHL